MPVTLTTHAREKGTYVVNAVFTDEDGDPVVPSTITWSLVKSDNTVINGRNEVNYTPPASSIDVVLKDADLEILDGLAEEVRWFVLEWTYTSSLGVDLPGKEEAMITVDNLHKIT